jgi:hypothetical protein
MTNNPACGILTENASGFLRREKTSYDLNKEDNGCEHQKYLRRIVKEEMH